MQQLGLQFYSQQKLVIWLQVLYNTMLCIFSRIHTFNNQTTKL
jgi:hypothetical protein